MCSSMEDKTYDSFSPKPGKEKYDKLVDIPPDGDGVPPRQVAGVVSVPKNLPLPKLDSGAALQVVKRIVILSKPEWKMVAIAVVMTVINGGTSLVRCEANQ